jgi:hypothetical protein
MSAAAAAFAESSHAAWFPRIARLDSRQDGPPRLDTRLLVSPTGWSLAYLPLRSAAVAGPQGVVVVGVDQPHRRPEPEGG